MSSGVTTTVSNWLLTGTIGPLGGGTSRSDVQALLGEPDDWLADTPKETSSVWRYGAMELGFDDDNAVHYFQVDTVNLASDSDGAIKLDWGPLGHEASLHECLRWLVRGRFEFDLRFDEWNTYIYLSNSYLTFAGVEDPRLVTVASPTRRPRRKVRG